MARKVSLAPPVTLSVVDQTGSGFGGVYALTSVVHTFRLDEDAGSPTCYRYGNRFEAIPSTTRFVPELRTPIPRVTSVVSAVVTGPDGENFFTDELGRVKVQFQWDRDGPLDDGSSAFLRVLLPTGRFDELYVPRVGTEVLVAFRQGNPDLPAVIGSVYNDLFMPPVELPENLPD